MFVNHHDVLATWDANELQYESAETQFPTSAQCQIYGIKFCEAQ